MAKKIVTKYRIDEFHFENDESEYIDVTIHYEGDSSGYISLTIKDSDKYSICNEDEIDLICEKLKEALRSSKSK